MTEINPDHSSAIMKQNILQLYKVYDLTPFLFTKNIRIHPRKKSISYPVLTLNTRFKDEPHKILSALLHHEMDWWLALNSEKTKKALDQLAKTYPQLPTHSKQVTHRNMIICYLEMEALSFYLGEKNAKKIIRDLMRRNKVFPWIYYQVLNKNFAIKKIVEKTGLLPPPL